MTLRETTIAKLQQLPESILHEVNNFIDFMLFKHQREAVSESEEDIAATWAKWFEAVEQLEISAIEPSSDYPNFLLDKYRQQGLDL